MRVGGRVPLVFEITNENDLTEAVATARAQSLPVFVLGGGTNVLAGQFHGAIILNRIRGIRGIGERIFRVGAGEVLDDVCAHFTEMGLSGMECMSGILGTVGGAVVQNSGAYGQDISQVLLEIEAYDMEADRFVKISNAEARLGYRSSIFKDVSERRYIITSVTVALRSEFVGQDELYFSLKNYLEKTSATNRSPSTLRDAVLQLRAEKLPSIEECATAGSFFKNPILSGDAAANWREKYPPESYSAMPDGQIKLFAGWLLDQCGLKGYESYGMQLYPKNALIAINKSANDLADIDKFTADVAAKVSSKFAVELEREPDTLTD
jgi:UDP-N-acetylmuramate dehydrogenase